VKAHNLPVATLENNPGVAYGKISAAHVPDFGRGTGFVFRKGDIVQPSDAPKLALLAKHAPLDYTVHLLELTEDDITQDAAGIRLAQIVGGSGVTASVPVESRVNLLAKQRGLLKINVERLEDLNEVEGVAVFTLYDTMAVEAGTEVAGVKVTPLVYPAYRLEQAQRVAGDAPVVDVLPFKPLAIGVIVRENLQPKPRARFALAVEQKIGWFGGKLLGIETVANTPEAISAAFSKFLGQNADIILHVGGHSSDPLDPVFPALHEQNIKMERHGAPAHPGTLFWLAYREATAVMGLASCGMFSQTTLGDIFLARLFAGDRLTGRDIAKMGHGGLFTREMSFRFPPYKLGDA
jgi:hypothetical protein